MNEVLSPAEASECRASAARANYLAADLPDVAHAVKYLCRDMAAPRRCSQAKLERVGRYLLEFPTSEWTYPDGRDKTDMTTIHAPTRTGRDAKQPASPRAEECSQ